MTSFKATKIQRIKALNHSLFEGKVKKYLEKKYFKGTVIRLDHKNYLPDWAVLYNGTITGFECKSYKTKDTISSAMKEWQNGQPKQYKKFMEIKQNLPIYMIFNLKEDTILVKL